MASEAKNQDDREMAFSVQIKDCVFNWVARTAINGRGKAVVLTPKNCTINGWSWPTDPEADWAWGRMNWSAATFQAQSIWTALYGVSDPHIRVPNFDEDCFHRIRGRRWKITALVPLDTSELAQNNVTDWPIEIVPADRNNPPTLRVISVRRRR